MIGLLFEGQAWCSGESCLTELPGRGFEAASPQILRGKGLSRFIPSPDPTHVGASGTGSAPFCVSQCSGYEVGKQTLNFQQSPFNIEASRQQ